MQKNATLVEEASDADRSLALVATDLRDLVAFFRGAG